SKQTGDAASPIANFGGRSRTTDSSTSYFSRMCFASASRNRFISVRYTRPLFSSLFQCHTGKGSIKFRRENGQKRSHSPIRDMMAPLLAAIREKAAQFHREEPAMPVQSRRSVGTAIISLALALSFGPSRSLAAEKSNAAQLIELAKSG